MKDGKIYKKGINNYMYMYYNTCNYKFFFSLNHSDRQLTKVTQGYTIMVDMYGVRGECQQDGVRGECQQGIILNLCNSLFNEEMLLKKTITTITSQKV